MNGSIIFNYFYMTQWHHEITESILKISKTLKLTYYMWWCAVCCVFVVKGDLVFKIQINDFDKWNTWLRNQFPINWELQRVDVFWVFFSQNHWVVFIVFVRNGNSIKQSHSKNCNNVYYCPVNWKQHKIFFP